MLLKAFSFITVSILVGQVFGVLRARYPEISAQVEVRAQTWPYILINAAQLAFLLLGWWGLVFARVLRRMEHVQLRMRRVRLPAA